MPGSCESISGGVRRLAETAAVSRAPCNGMAENRRRQPGNFFRGCFLTDIGDAVIQPYGGMSFYSARCPNTILCKRKQQAVTRWQPGAAHLSTACSAHRHYTTTPASKDPSCSFFHTRFAFSRMTAADSQPPSSLVIVTSQYGQK